MWRVSSYVLIAEVINWRVQFLVAVCQVPLFQFSAWEVVLNFIIITLVVVLLLAVLVRRLADEAPL